MRRPSSLFLRPTSWPTPEPKVGNGGFTDISDFTGEGEEPGGWAVQPRSREPSCRADGQGAVRQEGGTPGFGDFLEKVDKTPEHSSLLRLGRPTTLLAVEAHPWRLRVGASQGLPQVP